MAVVVRILGDFLSGDAGVPCSLRVWLCIRHDQRMLRRYINSRDIGCRF